MDDASELADRIVSELDDRGSDNLHSLLNTVIEPTGSVDEVNRLKEALAKILKRELGHLALERMHPRSSSTLADADAVGMLSTLQQWFRFDVSTQCWTLGNGDPLKDSYPVLVLEENGFSHARDVLEIRGYRWWMQRRTK